jgi:RHS repeat-associated protein
VPHVRICAGGGEQSPSLPRPLPARNSSDVVTRRYFDHGVVYPTSGVALYYGQDHLGSVRDISSVQGGAKVGSFDYDAYGDVTLVSGRTTPEFRYAGMLYHGASGLYLTNYRGYDPKTARWLSRDPLKESGGLNLYSYVEGNPLSYTDPLGLETYICKRPLGGKPGSFAPPVLNHTYVCVGSGENMTCGSTTASSGGVGSNIVPGSPGAPTTPDKDYYKPEACERRQGEDSCIETCIANELKKPTRPKYAIGPLGTDCQEYTEDVVSTCERRCVRR